MKIDAEKFKQFTIDNGYKLNVFDYVYDVSFGNSFSVFVPHTTWDEDSYNGTKDHLNICFSEYIEEDGLTTEVMPADGIDFLRNLMIRFGDE